MHNRLMACPRLAVSLLLPPSGRRWIAVESTSHKNVVELCEHLSTILHPLQIELVPVEDRVAWLDWQPKTTSLPPWVRIKRSSILQQLRADPALLKYAGDLAWVKGEVNCKATICMVPRLRVKIEIDGKKPRIKRLPRLFHPKAIAEQDETMDFARQMDPNVWWRPDRPHELENIEPGIHRLRKQKNADDLCLPFAIFEVPVALLQATDVAPTLNKLRVFSEGMAVGSAELGFKAPSKEFLRWTYECYMGAPLEHGHKVEVQTTHRSLVRGVIEDTMFECFTVRVVDTGEILEGVDAKSLRRFYEVGDAVRVIKSTHQDREGWVLDIQADVVDLVDRHTKETVRTH